MSNQRRSKMMGFIIAEASAIGSLLLIGSIALSFKPADPVLLVSINILTITAAVAVAVIPIAFFAVAPVLPRSGR
jgi:hypothetical protein